MNKTDIIIIGAGPVGLFTVFEAGLLGLNCILIDNLDKPGGQCAELYPEKPIYDIPGVPYQTGQEHVNALLEQIKPFSYELHLSERVDLVEEIDLEGDQFWKVKTTESKEFISKNIFIAAGAGSFEPRRPPNIVDPDKYINKGVEYAVRSVDKYANKDVFIFGGGDSALDWTVELSKTAKSISLVHRRDAFRGAQHTEELMRKLVKEKKVNLLTPYLIDSILGEEKVDSITLKNFDTNEIESFDADELIFLFGLNKKLGPILDWDIDLNNKVEKFETSQLILLDGHHRWKYANEVNLVKKLKCILVNFKDVKVKSYLFNINLGRDEFLHYLSEAGYIISKEGSIGIFFENDMYVNNNISNIFDLYRFKKLMQDENIITPVLEEVNDSTTLVKFTSLKPDNLILIDHLLPPKSTWITPRI